MNVKRFCAAILSAAAMLSLAGCLSPSFYVDPALGEVNPADRVTVNDKRPVQLIFEFQTNGTANAKAQKLLAKQITDQVSGSGLFSQVSTTPAASGALLSITINNVPQKDAAGKGFATGFTFGAVGTTVTDYYIATAKYVPAAGAATITKEAKHALHTHIGAGAAPEGMTPSKNAEEAVRTDARQLVDHLLNDIAKDPGFAPGPKTASLYSVRHVASRRG
jgi:hypothetical protein